MVKTIENHHVTCMFCIFEILQQTCKSVFVYQKAVVNCHIPLSHDGVMDGSMVLAMSSEQ